jgi:hypothetical protein
MVGNPASKNVTEQKKVNTQHPKLVGRKGIEVEVLCQLKNEMVA